VEIIEGGPKRNLGTGALSRAEPEVPILFPPAESRTNSDASEEAVEGACQSVAAQEKSEVLAAAASLKGDIVEA
jgi:hypothetical protein